MYSYSIAVRNKICSFAAARLINFTSLCKRFTVAYVALGKRIVDCCKVLKNEDLILFFFLKTDYLGFTSAIARISYSKARIMVVCYHPSLDALVNTCNLVSIFPDMLFDLSCKKMGKKRQKDNEKRLHETDWQTSTSC